MEYSEKDKEMFEHNRKIMGKILSFDGEVGIISAERETYIFSKRDYYSKEINVGDTVEFYKNTIPFGKERIKMARYIRTPFLTDDNKQKGKQ